MKCRYYFKKYHWQFHVFNPSIIRPIMNWKWKKKKMFLAQFLLNRILHTWHQRKKTNKSLNNNNNNKKTKTLGWQGEKKKGRPDIRGWMNDRMNCEHHEEGQHHRQQLKGSCEFDQSKPPFLFKKKKEILSCAAAAWALRYKAVTFPSGVGRVSGRLSTLRNSDFLYIHLYTCTIL
jgi:hypothetical protein